MSSVEQPFLTDPEIVRRLGQVEALLRLVIREARDRPYVEIGRAADELHRIAVDLMPDEARR